MMKVFLNVQVLCQVLFLVFLFTSPASAQRYISIAEAVQIGIKNNPELLIKNLEVIKSATYLDLAKKRPNPVFNAQILFLQQRNKFAANTGFGQVQNRQDWVQITKIIRPLGYRKATINRAKEEIQCQKISALKQQFELKKEIRMLYAWGVFNKKIENSIAKAQIAITNLVDKKKGVSKSTETLLKRKQILFDLVEVQEMNAQLAYKLAVNKLAQLIGVSDSVNLTNDLMLDFNPDSLISLNPVWELNSTNSLNEKTVKLYELDGEVLKRSTLPSPDLGIIINPQNTIPYLGLFVTMPIPIFYTNNLQRAVNETEISQAKLQRNYDLSKLKSDWYNFKLEYNYNSNLLTQAKALLQYSKSSLQEIELGYLQNRFSELEYLEALKSVLEAERTIIETEYKLNQSIIELAAIFSL